LQHADPSSGCAQHAPPLSSGFSLGVQQTEALSFGAQHDEGVSCLTVSDGLLFVKTGISSSVFINEFVSHRDADNTK
jgi:hypothetical protein